MATSPVFLLDIVTDPHGGSVQLRLSDPEGTHLASHDVRLASHRPAEWEGVFDTRNHVRRMELVQDEATSLKSIGNFIARAVLGPEVTRCIAAGEHQRTLVVRFPDTSDPLCAAFARIPWEIALPEDGGKTLFRRNLVVRAAPAGAVAHGVESLRLAPGEPLRVLLIFSEVPGSQPLAMRLEREELRQLFWREILPKHDVQVDVLCHGVTRRSIREKVRECGGYHVVHWSGHGHHDLLEIELDEGENAPQHISGADFVALFSEAGGVIPSLTFLSACHSGSLLNARDWSALRASLRMGRSSVGDVPSMERLLAGRPGYTGTALALLRAGVRQVVAMRYAVGDSYARRLAWLVYRGILAEPAHHSVDAALAIARRELGDDGKRAHEHSLTDHATPVVYGESPLRMIPAPRRSQQMKILEPRPQPLLQNGSRDLERPANFVGRTAELTQLQRWWFRSENVPITIVQGLAGLGKTALVAEAIHLWHHRFKYVIAFQVRGAPLSMEEFYRQFDSRLALTSQWYREHCAENELARVYFPPTRSLGAISREEALRNNLIDVLRNEAILLVLLALYLN